MRVLARLAVAYAAEEFCHWLDPKWGWRRAQLRAVRDLTKIIEDTTPAVVELAEHFARVGREIAELVAIWEGE